MPRYEIMFCDKKKVPLFRQFMIAPSASDAVQVFFVVNPNYQEYLKNNGLHMRVIEVKEHAVTFKRPLKERINWLETPLPWQ